jgi:hypothetical protein
MAQKSNLNTSRKNKINLSVQNSKLWVPFYKLLTGITRGFFLKGVWLTDYNVAFDTNLSTINFFIYYQKSCINTYKKKFKNKFKSKFKKQDIQNKKVWFSKETLRKQKQEEILRKENELKKKKMRISRQALKNKLRGKDVSKTKDELNNKLTKSQKASNKLIHINKKKKIGKFLSRLFERVGYLAYTSYVFKFKTLNVLLYRNKLYRSQSRYFFFKLKQFKDSVFSRRDKLFIDFIKLTVLFFNNCIGIRAYTKVWSRAFKFISKRMHGKFFGFIKTTIQAIVNYPHKITTKDRIEGIRMVVSGRLKGKQRSASKRFWAGNVPTQSLGKNVEFCSTPSITLYGTFGLKFWIYKTQKSLSHLSITSAARKHYLSFKKFKEKKLSNETKKLLDKKDKKIIKKNNVIYTKKAKI